MTTNLRREEAGFAWAFDLEGIEELYRSYETTSLWPLLYSPPEGLEIDFVRAEHSHFQWTDQLAHQIETLGRATPVRFFECDVTRWTVLGHRVHLLKNAGHWVHTDNPEGLYRILSSSLGHCPFAHAQTALV